jgi:hypothetical protein
MKIAAFGLSVGLSFCCVIQSALAKSVDSITACRALVLEQSEFSHRDDSLRGIREVSILMEPFPRPFRPAPPSVDMDEIKKAVEQKCRSRGLQIAEGHDWKTPVLTVMLREVYGTRSEQGAYFLTIELSGISVLARDMKTRILSRLYSFERLECLGELLPKQEITADVLDSVEHFIIEWERENAEEHDDSF